MTENSVITPANTKPDETKDAKRKSNTTTDETEFNIIDEGFIRNILLFAISILAIASIAANVALFITYPDNWIDKVIYGTIGFMFDLFKIFALVGAAALAKRNFHGKALTIRIIWACLVVASLMAAFGYMAFINATRENNALRASGAYQLAVKASELAQVKVDQLSKYADNNATLQAKEQLAKLQRLREEVLQAHSQWMYPDCIPKRDARGVPYAKRAYEACTALRTIEQQMVPHQEFLDSHTAYLSALEYKNMMDKQLLQVNPAADVLEHPQWVAMASVLGVDPRSAKFGFTLFIASMIEAICALGLWAISGLRTQRVFTPEETIQAIRQWQRQQHLYYDMNTTAEERKVGLTFEGTSDSPSAPKLTNATNDGTPYPSNLPQ